MNCKPGDLAMVVRTPVEYIRVQGHIVRVTTPCSLYGVQGWCYEKMPLRGRHGTRTWAWHEIPDEWLRPIRDPGEDARDESLSWKPVPASKELA